MSPSGSTPSLIKLTRNLLVLQHNYKSQGKVVPYDRVYLDRRDEMAFEAAERGDADAIETLILIEMRDPDPAKRKRASELMARLQVESAP